MSTLATLAHQIVCEHAHARRGYDWLECDSCGYLASRSTIGAPRENVERAIRRALHDLGVTVEPPTRKD